MLILYNIQERLKDDIYTVNRKYIYGGSGILKMEWTESEIKWI